MTKIIGLTGGIGSGKSTAAKFFIDLGVPVYFADDAGREVMNTPEIIEAVRQTFGESVISSSLINRKQLASIVFNDKEKLEALNNIVHPAVKSHFDQWLLQHTSAPFIIKEAAILFESGSYKYCDKIICVTAPEHIRLARVQQRDFISEQEIKARMNSQWTDEQRIDKSDFVIQNMTLKELQKQIIDIYHKLKALY